MSAPATSSPRIVRCPTCGEPSVFAPANSWRPFCSQRCKNHDLGAWASETYCVEVKPETDQDEDAARER